ncbi:DUF6381 family protein [Streptomyces sp. 2P-4]|uniref:DUF6381 family protein n=1 Tax=Streptomyces sp. 2P-4 TaxID=2931974 RepID=UPI00253F883C|nr:DUF6381 family protein [Streptomyces sp. 2P-4]
MSDGKQPGEPTARRMREEAEELELAARHASDPDERRRLTDEALRIRERIERESGPEGATMDPM